MYSDKLSHNTGRNEFTMVTNRDNMQGVPAEAISLTRCNDQRSVNKVGGVCPSLGSLTPHHEACTSDMHEGINQAKGGSLVSVHASSDRGWKDEACGHGRTKKRA